MMVSADRCAKQGRGRLLPASRHPLRRIALTVHSFGTHGTGRNIIPLQRSSLSMTQSASPDNSDMVSIRVSRATQEKLKKLKKGNMTYDDVISQMVDDENWDVEKLDADLDTIEKKSKFYTFEEVFKGV